MVLLVIEEGIFTSGNLICCTGSTVYYSYVPKPLTERERLQLQINDLKLELELLKREKLKSLNLMFKWFFKIHTVA